MNRQEAGDRARDALASAERGDDRDLVRQLNDLSLQDRLTVTRQMQMIVNDQQKTDQSAPDLQISTGKDSNGNDILLSLSEKSKKDGTAISIEYDQGTGKLKAEELNENNKYVEHRIYDLVSGKMTSLDDKEIDGSTSHTTYDATTGRAQAQDIYHRDGFKSHNIFDPTSGGIKSSDTTYADGFQQHDEYVPSTGKLLYQDLKYPDGHTKHIAYNPKTGFPIKSK
jgi:hypothetical protein